MEAVRTDGTLLETIRLSKHYDDAQRETYLSDKDIVSAAVVKCGWMIRYASETCRTNSHIVMTALTARDNPASLRYIPPALIADPCITLCAPMTTRSPSTVDALLTVMEANLEDCAVDYKDAFIHKYMTHSPFTADTVLSLFMPWLERRHWASTDRLGLLAHCVSTCSSYFQVQNAALTGEDDVRRNVGVLTEDTVDKMIGILSSKGYENSGIFCTYGVSKDVAERLQRQSQIADALPFISRSIRSYPDTAHRAMWTRRVEDMAAKIHHPEGALASLVHKRSFAEAFA